MPNNLFSRGQGYEDPYREDEDDYDRDHRRSFSRGFSGNSYGRIVDNVALQIARAAFGSSKRNQRVRHYCFEARANIFDQLKSFSQQPLVKETMIISSAMLLKGLLWMVYRKASDEDLEIVDL